MATSIPFIETAALLQAGEELLSGTGTPSGGHDNDGTLTMAEIHLVAQQLHLLLQQAQSRLAKLATASWDTAMKKIGVGQQQPSATIPVWSMPTALQLKTAGFTLASLMQANGQLTPHVLIQAGVIRSLMDAMALGIKNMQDLVQVVGPPVKIRHWLHQCTGSHVAWERDFVQPLNFTSLSKWEPVAHLLRPKDLKALGFSLSAHLDAAQPDIWHTSKVLYSPGHKKKDGPVEVATWLTRDTKSQWLKHGQLTMAQYDRLIAGPGQQDTSLIVATPTPPPAIPTLNKTRAYQTFHPVPVPVTKTPFLFFGTLPPEGEGPH